VTRTPRGGWLAVLLLALACSHAPPAETPPPRPLTTASGVTPEAVRVQGIAAPIDAGTQSALDRAVAQGRNGDLPGAERSFQDIVNRNPNVGPAWVNLGVLAERRGDQKRAEEMYRRGAQCTPDPPEAWEYLARLLVRQGRAAQAGQLLRGRLQQSPEAHGARNALTWVLLEEKHLPEAEAEAKKVLKVDEQNVRAMQLLAQCYFRQGKYELSRLVLENARAIDPQDPVTHNALGTVLLKLKQRPAALESFKTAASLRPDFAEAHSNFGAMLVENGDFDGAVKELESAVGAAPDMLGARLNLGNAYRGKLELAKAKEQYDKVVARDPTLPDTYYNLAILHLDSEVPGVDTIERYKQAIAYFTTYKQKGGTDERVEQYLKDAAKGIDREQRRREREKKDQLRKAQQAEKDAAAAQKPAEAAADTGKSAVPPATETSAPPPSQGRLKKKTP
jgi:tetratricopeptide (TPR) repeat protein